MNPKEKVKSYQPSLSRGFSSASLTEEGTMSSDAEAFITQPVKRGKSLVRPERERIDPNHRQYHYHQAASQAPNDSVQPSRTGNLPRTLSRRGTTNLRRGKSVLGREEKGTTEEEFEYQQQDDKKTWSSKIPGPWMTYCYLITCCVPPQLLSCAGIPRGQAQSAWREKIGLVGVIMTIMGFVGFLTFGFTAATCPIQAVAVHGNEVTPGYLVIKGWAYMLADWQGHPSSNGSINVLYPPINGAGMDGSLLFPTYTSACDNVFLPLQGQQPNYFPCQLFNPNVTVAPDPSQYTNKTNCHTSSAALEMFESFRINGVPKPDGGYNKAARVYYDYEDVNATSHLMLYNK